MVLPSLLFSVPVSALVRETGGNRIAGNAGRGPDFLRYTAAFSIIVIGAFMFSIPLMADIPSVISALHIDTLYVAVLSLIGFAGFVLAGYLSDRYGRGYVAIGFAGSGAVSGIMLYLTGVSHYLLPVLALVYVSSGFFSFSGIWVSEHYPPGSRGLATNIVFFSGRLVGGFSPFIAALIDPPSLVSGIALVGIAAALISLVASAYVQGIRPHHSAGTLK